MKRAFSDFVLTVSYPWIFRITLLWTILYDNWNHFSKRRHSFFFFLIHSRHFNRIHPHIYKTIILQLFLYNNFSFLKINFKDHISKNLSIEYFKLLNTFSHFDIPLHLHTPLPMLYILSNCTHGQRTLTTSTSMSLRSFETKRPSTLLSAKTLTHLALHTSFHHPPPRCLSCNYYF